MFWSDLLPVMLMIHMMAAWALLSSSSSATLTPVRLWISKSCPYAHRAWLCCKEKELEKLDGVDFELREVDLQNKPQDFVDTYRSISPTASASAKVPILEV